MSRYHPLPDRWAFDLFFQCNGCHNKSRASFHNLNMHLRFPTFNLLSKKKGHTCRRKSQYNWKGCYQKSRAWEDNSKICFLVLLNMHLLRTHMSSSCLSRGLFWKIVTLAFIFSWGFLWKRAYSCMIHVFPPSNPWLTWTFFPPSLVW